MNEHRIGLVLMLLREGNVSEAVSVYQDETGVSAGVAQKCVYDLAQKHGIPTRRRSILALALIALASAIGLVLSN